VARASLEELLEDYRDFLRTRGLVEWKRDDPGTDHMRLLNRTPDADYETFRKMIEAEDPGVSANAIIGLIKLTNYLLDQQLRAQEKAFMEQGGMREAMARARYTKRNQTR
jgi:four helix bundle suffix protein